MHKIVGTGRSCLWFYSLIKCVMHWIIWGECIHWMHLSEWIHTCLGYIFYLSCVFINALLRSSHLLSALSHNYFCCTKMCSPIVDQNGIWLYGLIRALWPLVLLQPTFEKTRVFLKKPTGLGFFGFFRVFSGFWVFRVFSTWGQVLLENKKSSHGLKRLETLLLVWICLSLIIDLRKWKISLELNLNLVN